MNIRMCRMFYCNRWRPTDSNFNKRGPCTLFSLITLEFFLNVLLNSMTKIFAYSDSTFCGAWTPRFREFICKLSKFQQNEHTTGCNHSMWQIGSLNWAQFILPFRKNSIVSITISYNERLCRKLIGFHFSVRNLRITWFILFRFLTDWKTTPKLWKSRGRRYQTAPNAFKNIQLLHQVFISPFKL